MRNFVLMEVGKKQNYIFKSSRLKENIGASMIIRYVTEGLPKDVINKYNGKAIIKGGGKGLYEFSTEDEAKNFVREISNKVIKEFPGLEIYFVKRAINEDENMVESISNLYVALGKKKAKRKNSIRQCSLGIEKNCSSTGLPAAKIIEGEFYSEEVCSKLEFYKANITEYFTEDGDKFSSILDDLKSDGKSYIAIVHIDGNSMGNKFTKLAEKYKEKIKNDKKYNNEYIESLHILSESIDKIYMDSFKKVIKESYDSEGKATVRPIIIAGDDITFIAQAKDAIRLSKVFIDGIIDKKVKIGDEEIKLNATAGIAFIKSHYPFDRGYALAENLVGNCKLKLKKNKEDASMIDWHIVQGEGNGSIEEIRKNYYKIEGDITLNLRPLYLNKKTLNSYETFQDSLNQVHNSKDVPRSKWKSLRGELSKGRKYNDMYVTYYGLEKHLKFVNGFLKESDTNNGIQLEKGISDITSVYFDAIEIMDIVKEV